MKKLFILLFIFVSVQTFAVYLSSPFSGETISYIPKVGQIIKKGDPLVKFSTVNELLVLKALELTLNDVKEIFKDSKTDIKRAKALLKSKAVSVKAYEDVCFLHEKALINVQLLKLDIKEQKLLVKDFTRYAPYDLKVKKVFLCVDAGTDFNTPILDIEKL